MRYLLSLQLLLLCACSTRVLAQTQVTILPNTLYAPVSTHFTPGVFYVPKTNAAHSDFMNNGIHQNCIRTHVIESALNNTSDLTSCLALLNTAQTDLQNLAGKCDKLIFIFEKMPAWLSSSSDGSPAATPGWYVLNTKPPANWNTWQTVVDSITRKLVTQFGIGNAYFEVWNEPDIGSWTGTMAEYFELYKRTYSGIKASSNLNRVGGPVVNFWANNIYWKPPYGHLTTAQADSSLLGQLLDSAVVWNKIPDFVSWHNFSITYYDFQQAAAYLQLKTNTLAIPSIPIIVSEWNAPSVVRDSPLATSYIIKGQLEISRTSTANNAIAAWQDFSQNINEFHNDYGLLTYGAIHKPAYNSILLSQQLRGMTCNMSAFSPFDGMASVVNDTLFVVLSNYAPPPLVEALNYTLFAGQWNANQLDSAGYIDLASSNFARLDSIYRGLITLSGSNALEIDINNSIGVYNHYDSLATNGRTFVLNTTYS
ncbi:MAG: GH39 family glycosyl hydrolase, partial [Bacteroidia bacterium]